MTVHVTTVFSRFLEEMDVPDELVRNLRRADDFIRLGVIAGHRVLQQRMEKNAEAQKDESCGLVLATQFGPMETNFEVLDHVVSGEQTSPTLFSHSVFNGAAGYMASTLRLKGCGLTITDFDFPFFRALQQGWLTVLSGRLELCLVLQVESYSMLLKDAKEKHAPGTGAWKPGVVCWLLENKKNDGSERAAIQSLQIETKSHPRNDFLSFTEQLNVAGFIEQCHTPLQAAFSLGTRIRMAEAGAELHCRLESRFGSVNLVVQK